MGQLDGQHEWLIKPYHHVHHVRRQWLRKQAPNVETIGGSQRLGDRHIKHLQAERRPLVCKQLRDEEFLVVSGQGDAQAPGARYDRHGALGFSIAHGDTGPVRA